MKTDMFRKYRNKFVWGDIFWCWCHISPTTIQKDSLPTDQNTTRNVWIKILDGNKTLSERNKYFRDSSILNIIKFIMRNLLVNWTTWIMQFLTLPLSIFSFRNFLLQTILSVWKLFKEMASLKSWITSNVYCHSAFHINATLFSSSVIRFLIE